MEKTFNKEILDQNEENRRMSWVLADSKEESKIKIHRKDKFKSQETSFNDINNDQKKDLPPDRIKGLEEKIVKLKEENLEQNEKLSQKINFYKKNSELFEGENILLKKEIEKFSGNHQDSQSQISYYKKNIDKLEVENSKLLNSNLDLKKEIISGKEKHDEIIGSSIEDARKLYNEKIDKIKIEHDSCKQEYSNEKDLLNSKILKLESELYNKNQNQEKENKDNLGTIEMLISMKKDMEGEFEKLKNDFLNVVNENKLMSAKKTENFNSANIKNDNEYLKKEIEFINEEYSKKQNLNEKETNGLKDTLCITQNEIDSLKIQLHDNLEEY